MRAVLIWIAAAFVFGSFYYMVAQKEAQLRNGQTVYLALAPVDPRSLLQGDYMALRYQITNKINEDPIASAQAEQPVPHTAILTLDAHHVGTFARYDDGRPLATGEFRLKFHRRDRGNVIGAESFFIPEGSGTRFAAAAYGELKLAADGTPLLVALCDGNRQPIVVTEGTKR